MFGSVPSCYNFVEGFQVVKIERGIIMASVKKLKTVHDAEIEILDSQALLFKDIIKIMKDVFKIWNEGQKEIFNELLEGCNNKIRE